MWMAANGGKWQRMAAIPSFPRSKRFDIIVSQVIFSSSDFYYGRLKLTANAYKLTYAMWLRLTLAIQ